MQTDLVAFMDESKKPVRDRSTGKVSDRGEYYVVAAAVVLNGDLDQIRGQIKAVEATLGWPLHHNELRTRQRRIATIEAISAIRDWDGYLFETARPLPRQQNEHHVRAKLLEEAYMQLGAEDGVIEAVLESRADTKEQFKVLDKKDQQVREKLSTQKAIPASFRVRHDNKSEQLFQLADLIAGTRSDYLCGVNLDAYPLIAHRVTSTRQLFK